MANQLFQAMGGNLMNNLTGNVMQNVMDMPQLMKIMANPAQLSQQYEQFRKQYQGNAEEEVKKMIQEGKISNQQVKQLMVFAQMLPK